MQGLHERDMDTVQMSGQIYDQKKEGGAESEYLHLIPAEFILIITLVLLRPNNGFEAY